MPTQCIQDHADARALVVAGRTVAGAGWVAVGLAAGWLVFATPLLVRAVNINAGSTLAPFLQAVAWAAAVTAPTCFILLGAIRLASAATHLRGRTRLFRPVHAMAGRLPAGMLTLATVRLPDGRAIPDVVLDRTASPSSRRSPPPRPRATLAAVGRRVPSTASGARSRTRWNAPRATETPCGGSSSRSTAASSSGCTRWSRPARVPARSRPSSRARARWCPSPTSRAGSGHSARSGVSRRPVSSASARPWRAWSRRSRPRCGNAGG